MSRTLRSAVLATASCWLASTAFAHAPLPRELAVSPGGAIAVRMPGFGWLVRSGDDAAFAYACDALFGVSPLEEHAPMAYRGDGALLVGTARGVRLVDDAGCPVGSAQLEGMAVSALATHGQIAYAVAAAEDQPLALHRSEDGGERWQRAAELGPQPVTALVIDAGDPDRVYVSQAVGAGQSLVLASSDGGASFEAFEQTRELTLLAAHGNPATLWAKARVPDQGVGVSILRAQSPAGPWLEVLAVNFFGGLAFDPEAPDVIWIGDEARGVFRSNDGGDSFAETQPDISSASLAFGAGELWSCTPGLPEKPALMRSPDAIAPFSPAMAFRDVTELVSCDAPIDVAQSCAAAWIEWRRDVLGVPPEDLVDAGVQQDASVAEDASASDAGSPVKPRETSPGCSLRGGERSSAGWLAPATLVALRALRRRRRLRTI